MTYLVLNCADVEEANSKPINERWRFLEMKRKDPQQSGAILAQNDPPPRLLKSHL